MHWPLSPFPLHLVLIALLSLTGAGARASEPVHPVTCVAPSAGIGPGSEIHLDGICEALQNRPDIIARGAGLQLVLIVEDLRPDHVTAYLEWQGANGRMRGPSVEFGFLDTSLGSVQYDFIAAGLTQATNFP
jgi:hypothetical protein